MPCCLDDVICLGNETDIKLTLKNLEKVYMYVRACVRACMCEYTYTHTHTYTYMYVCIDIYVCVFIHVYTYTYTYT